MDLKNFADNVIRMRRAIAVFVLVMFIAATIGLSRLEFDDNPRDVLRSEDDEFTLLEEVFNQFGPDENLCYLIVSFDQLFSQRSLADLRQLVAEVD